MWSQGQLIRKVSKKSFLMITQEPRLIKINVLYGRVQYGKLHKINLMPLKKIVNVRQKK